jgi:hypothetical protein
MAERKSFLLRIDPALHAALEKWAADEPRRVYAQPQCRLSSAVGDARRTPRSKARHPR